MNKLINKLVSNITIFLFFILMKDYDQLAAKSLIIIIIIIIIMII